MDNGIGTVCYTPQPFGLYLNNGEPEFPETVVFCSGIGLPDEPRAERGALPLKPGFTRFTGV